MSKTDNFLHIEIPSEIKDLYRHWDAHTRDTGGKNIDAVIQDKELRDKLAYFIRERILIWSEKIKGEKPPYTSDHVLATYRFCNIFREFDRQTIDFHTLLNPLRENFSLWLLNMFYCRMVARPETIGEVGLLSFDQRKSDEVYERFKKVSRPRFGTPYVFPVSTIMKSNTPTRELFITNYLPSIMEKVATEISSWKKESAYNGVQKVIGIFGYNHTFLWTEVLIDVAYQYPEFIDLFAEFPIGPGSLPTMLQIDPVMSKKTAHELAKDLAHADFDTGITVGGKTLKLSAENWEGIGCEFRKYTNLSSGRGRKRIYKHMRSLL